MLHHIVSFLGAEDRVRLSRANEYWSTLLKNAREVEWLVHAPCCRWCSEFRHRDAQPGSHKCPEDENGDVFRSGDSVVISLGALEIPTRYWLFLSKERWRFRDPGNPDKEVKNITGPGYFRETSFPVSLCYSEKKNSFGFRVIYRDYPHDHQLLSLFSLRGRLFRHRHGRVEQQRRTGLVWGLSTQSQLRHIAFLPRFVV